MIVKVQNSPITGLTFQVIAPNGGVPHAAYLALYRRMTPEEYDYSPEAQYQLVGNGDYQVDTAGLVTIPGVIALDLHQYVAVVSGECDIDGQWAEFICTRTLEGPDGLVIDCRSAVATTWSMLDLGNQPLKYPVFALRLCDESGARISTQFFEPLGDSLKLYLDAGTYDAYAFWSAYHAENETEKDETFSGPTYFLKQEGKKVDRDNSDFTFASVGKSRVLTGATPDKSADVSLYVYQEALADVLDWPIDVSGEELVIPPGEYQLSANIYCSNWRYGLTRERTVTAGTEPLVQNFGGELTYQGQVAQNQIKKGTTLSVSCQGIDAYGNLVTTVDKPVSSYYWKDVYVHMQTYDANDTRAYHGADANSFSCTINRTISRDPGEYTVQIYAEQGPLFGYGNAETELLPFTILPADQPAAKKQVSVTGPDGQPCQLQSAIIYRLLDYDQGQYWSGHYSTVAVGNISIPEDLELSGESNLLVCKGDYGGKSYVYTRPFSSLDDLTAIDLTDCTVEIDLTLLDRSGEELVGQFNLQLHPSCGAEASGPSAVSVRDHVYVTPADYAFTASCFAGEEPDYERYFLSQPSGTFTQSASPYQVVMDGSQATRVEADMQNGYQLYQLNLSRDQYYVDITENVPVAYVPPGTYTPFAVVSLTDETPVDGPACPKWTYLLDIAPLQLPAGEDVSVPAGGPFTVDFELAAHTLTIEDTLEGQVEILDVAGNRVHGVEASLDWGSASMLEQFMTQGAITRTEAGDLALPQPEVTAEYQWPFIFPFLRLYRVDPQSGEETRVLNAYGEHHFESFSTPLSELTPGRYRVELAVAMSSQGPVTTGNDQRYYISVLAAGATMVDEGLRGKHLNSQSFIVSGSASPGSQVEIFAYQETMGETPIATATADQYGNFSATVQVLADGSWQIVARRQGGAASEPVTVHVDTAAPAQPVLQAELTADQGSVQLSWVGEAGAAAIVYRDGRQLTTVDSGSTYTDETVERGSSYSYQVALRDAAGNLSALSMVCEITIPSGLNTAVVRYPRGLGGLATVSGALTIEAVGSSGFSGKAVLHLETAAGASTEEVSLSETATPGRYAGQFTIREGVTHITQVATSLLLGETVLPGPEALQGATILVGGTISGTVTRENRGAVQAITIALREKATGRGVGSTKSDVSGRFSFGGLTAGEYTVSVYDALSYGRSERTVTAANGTVSDAGELTLPARYDLMLTVSSAADGGTVAGISVYLHGAGLWRTAATDQAGQVQFAGLPAGHYFWETQNGHRLNPGFGNASGAFELTTADIDHPVSLTPLNQLTGSFRGTVRDSQGQPFAGATVSVYSNANWQYCGRGSAVTGQDGMYEIPALLAGTDYRMTIEHPGYRQLTLTDQPINAQQATVIDQQLQKCSAISGVVRGQGPTGEASPLKGALVFVGNRYWSHSSTLTGEDGSFTLTDVAPGQNIRVQVDGMEVGYGLAEETIGELLPEQTAELTLTVAEMGSLDGYLTTAAGSPLQRAVVRIDSLGKYTLTDVNGYYLLSGLLPGEHEVTALQAGYLSVRRQCTVTTGLRGEADFVLHTAAESRLALAGVGNRFSVSAAETAPGSALTYLASYRNNLNQSVDDAELRLEIPQHATLVPDSLLVNGLPSALQPIDGLLVVPLGTLAAQTAGTVTYQLQVAPDLSEEAELVSVCRATWSVAGESCEAALGVARTSLVFAFISAPTQTEDGEITVFGKSVPGANVLVYDGDRLLGTTMVTGRWWYLDVSLPLPATGTAEVHQLSAVAVKDGLRSNPSSPAEVTVGAGGPVLLDAYISMGWGMRVPINPYLGIVGFGILEKSPFAVHLSFSEAVPDAKIIWLGEEYPAELVEQPQRAARGGITAVNYVAQVPGGWGEFGEAYVGFPQKDPKTGKTTFMPLAIGTILIDPSGYVYEAVDSNRLSGVTATVQRQVGEEWQTWDADAFGQINPQVTDEQGRYGWDVPAGVWRVVFERDGYQDYVSYPDWDGQVPPAKLDLNVGLVTTALPVVSSHLPVADAANASVNAGVSVTFSSYMRTASLTGNIVLTLEADGSVVPGTITAVSEEAGLARTFTFTPDQPLVPLATYRVSVLTGEDYAGRLLDAAVSWLFTTAVDAHPGQLQFAAANDLVNEGAAQVTITINRVGGSDGTVTVAYATQDGTARAGSDYTAQSGSLSFADGVVSQSFTLAILDDSLVEGDETFAIALSNPAGGATLGVTSSMTLTIRDNDSAADPGASEPDPEPQSPQNSSWIGNAGGSFASQGVTVEIPAGALPSGARLTIRLCADDELAAILTDAVDRLTGDVFDITVSGVSDFSGHTLAILLPCNLALIPEGYQPIGHYYDEASSQWIAVPTTLQERDGQTYVLLTVDHLTKFAVFTAEVPVTEPEPLPETVIRITIGSLTARVGEHELKLDAEPLLRPGRTLVPVRFVGEMLGAEVKWLSADRQVVITTAGGSRIVLTIGLTEVTVDGRQQAIDCAPEILADRTFVPLRFVAETLGARVDYEPSARTITVSKY